MSTPAIGPTRTEADLAAHIAHTMETDGEAPWILVVEQLHPHQSATLVRLVAERCGRGDDCGVKEHSGLRQSMKTRAAFLAEPTHRLRLVSPPQPTAWLHQIAIGCGILARRLLQRGSFPSTEDWRTRLLACIDSFNKTTAKPFQWTSMGRPLMA